jgi:signal transduction histidine kinase/CheY-like chemotaxis protein/HAMP domain-containing protein
MGLSSLRFKLLAIVAAAALGLTIIVVAGEVAQRRVDAQLDSIRDRFIPKIGLRGQVTGSFERVRHRLQDAAQAGDTEALDDAHREQIALLGQLDTARGAIAPDDLASLRVAIVDYYQAAEPVTRRMIKGESPDALAHELEAMQAKQAHATELIDRTTGFDKQALTDAFTAATDAETSGAHYQLALSLASLALVLALSIWITRGLYRSFADLAAGFRRFGAGDFATEIPARRADEVGAIARDANEMASRLRALGDDRDRTDWIKAGQVGLAIELRAELAPEEVADRAIRFLVRYLGAAAGIVYARREDGRLHPLGATGVAKRPTATFALGEDLVGEAAQRAEPTVLTVPAGRMPIRSGLVEGDPRSLVLAPLVVADKITGLVELATIAEWSARDAELLHAVRDAIAIALEVAHGRAAAVTLLVETQRQAAELLEARRGLEQKADELARASAYKSQFLANMSHELRTPLNAILGFSELMHDGLVPPGPQQHEFLGDILRSGRHLLQLINDVLDLSKVEAGKLEFLPEPIQASAMIDEVLGILRTSAASARVTVESHVEPAIEALELDPARLKQVLYNYLSNAIKFTPEGGRITIRALAEGDRVRFEVEDTGVGISPAGLARLFGEFQQVSTDGQKRGGTGLGLALTKRLVEAQGGTVGVKSTVGVGTTFHAVLPRTMKRAPAVALPQPIHVSANAPSVLVIEDDPADQRALVEILGAAGYAVDVTSSGRDALARCKERTFDAITLDLLLPDMSGLEVLHAIRGSKTENRDVPVVVITVVAERGAVAGFAVHDILAKPVNTDALIGSLSRAHVPPHDGTVLVIDDDIGSLKLMAATLERLGYAARCEQDGPAGLLAVRAAPPAAIVLDLLMPGMSGFEFLDRLRRDESGRRVPVIVWTSKDLGADERSRLRASASAVVTKGEHSSAAVLAELAALVPPK